MESLCNAASDSEHFSCMEYSQRNLCSKQLFGTRVITLSHERKEWINTSLCIYVPIAAEAAASCFQPKYISKHCCQASRVGSVHISVLRIHPLLTAEDLSGKNKRMGGNRQHSALKQATHGPSRYSTAPTTRYGTAVRASTTVA